MGRHQSNHDFQHNSTADIRVGIAGTQTKKAILVYRRHTIDNRRIGRFDLVRHGFFATPYSKSQLTDIAPEPIVYHIRLFHYTSAD